MMEDKTIKYVLLGYVEKILQEQFAIFKVKLSFLTDILLLAQMKKKSKSWFIICLFVSKMSLFFFANSNENNLKHIQKNILNGT